MIARLIRSAPLAGLVGAALLSAGCGTLAPAYERPPAPVAAAFPGAAASAAAPASAAAARAAADIPWAEYYTDAGLRRLIALALANNRDLRAAVASIERARATLGLRQADQWPTVGVGLGASLQPNSSGSGTLSTYTAGLALTAYELDLFGRVRAGVDAAQAQALASEEARRAAQISLVASVATTHLALRADEELLRMTRQTLATREDSARLMKLRVDNGASSLLDLRSAESLLQTARVALAQAERQRALDENALVLLVGQPLPPALLPTAVDGQKLASLPELPAGLPSDVLLRRPDVRQAELALVAAHADIGAARAAFFPRITLTGSVGRASSELSGLFSGGSLAWTFVPQLLQPLFDAGRNESNLQLARASRELALAQYERAIQSAFREVADALAGRETLAAQEAAQRALTAAEQGRYDLALLRQRGGASSTLDLLDAQRSLFAAQQALVQVQAARAQNAVLLYRVLGGGWVAQEPAPARNAPPPA